MKLLFVFIVSVSFYGCSQSLESPNLKLASQTDNYLDNERDSFFNDLCNEYGDLLDCLKTRSSVFCIDTGYFHTVLDLLYSDNGDRFVRFDDIYDQAIERRRRSIANLNSELGFSYLIVAQTEIFIEDTEFKIGYFDKQWTGNCKAIAGM